MKIGLNDQELVTLAQQKNEEAMDRLIKRYSVLIRKMADSYFGVGVDYQDFLQEGMLAFVKSIKNFDHSYNASFYSYSMTCVRNALTSNYRSLRRRSGKDILVESMVSVVSEEDDENYKHNWKLDDILNKRMILEKAAVGNVLSDLEKECLKFKLLDNTDKEIGNILGISTKSVENALRRCRKKLEKMNDVKIKSIDTTSKIPRIIDNKSSF